MKHDSLLRCAVWAETGGGNTWLLPLTQGSGRCPVAWVRWRATTRERPAPIPPRYSRPIHHPGACHRCVAGSVTASRTRGDGHLGRFSFGFTNDSRLLSPRGSHGKFTKTNLTIKPHSIALYVLPPEGEVKNRIVLRLVLEEPIYNIASISITKH
jgi:hypothetical protein